MKEMSGILNERLFFSIKHPRESLLEVRALTASMRDSFSFFPFDNIESLSPNEFMESMEKHRKHFIRSM